MGHDSGGLVVPGPGLSRSLQAGTRAALATGAIFLVGLGAAAAQGVTDLTLANFLGWMALIPGFWIAGAFAKLGAAAGRPSVGTSAACLFATAVVAQLYDLAELGVLPPAAAVVVWIAFALGLVVAVALPFVYEPQPADAAPPEAAAAPEPPAGGGTTPPTDAGWKKGTEPAPAGGSLAGLLTKGAGFLVVLVVGVIKFGGKALAKVAAVQGVRGLAGLGLDWGELAAVLGALALLILLFVYVVWFAVAKILARRRLGAVAALLGAAELVGFVVVIGGTIAAVIWLAVMAEGPDDDWVQRWEAQLLAGATAVSFTSCVVWSLLVAWLFASVRRRAEAPSDPVDGARLA